MAHVLTRSDGLREAIEEAYRLVADAVARLDEVGASPDIAAHLDLAMHRMSAELDRR